MARKPRHNSPDDFSRGSGLRSALEKAAMTSVPKQAIGMQPSMLHNSSKQELGCDDVTWAFQHEYFGLYPAPQVLSGLPVASRRPLPASPRGAGSTASMHNLDGLTPPSLPQGISATTSAVHATSTQPSHVQMAFWPNTEGQHIVGTGSAGLAADQAAADHPAIPFNSVAATLALDTAAFSQHHLQAHLAGAAGQPVAWHCAGTAATVMPDTAPLQQMMQKGAPKLSIAIPEPSVGDTAESASTYLAFTPGSVTWPASYPLAAALMQQEPAGPGAATVAAATAAGWDWHLPEAAAMYAAAVNAATMTSAGPTGLHSTAVCPPAVFSDSLQEYGATIFHVGNNTTAMTAVEAAPNARFEALDQLTAFMYPRQAVHSNGPRHTSVGAGVATNEHLLQLDTTDVSNHADEAMHNIARSGTHSAWQQRNQQQNSKQQHIQSGRHSKSRRYLPGLFDQWAATQPTPLVAGARDVAVTTSAGQAAAINTVAGTMQETSSTGRLAHTAAEADQVMKERLKASDALVADLNLAAASAPELDQWLQQQAQQQQVLQQFEAAAAAAAAGAAAKAEQYGLADIMWVMEAEAAAERAGMAAAAEAKASAATVSPAAKECPPAGATAQSPQEVPEHQTAQRIVKAELQQQQQVLASTPSGSGSQRQGMAGIRKLLSPGVYSFGASPLNSPTPSLTAAANTVVASPSPVQSRAPAAVAQLLPQPSHGPAASAGLQGLAGAASPAHGQQDHQHHVVVSSNAATGSDKAQARFLSDQFAAPQSAVAALMELQEAAAARGDPQTAPTTWATSSKPRNRRANKRFAPSDGQASGAVVRNSTDTAAAAAADVLQCSLACDQAGLGGSPLQPLFIDDSRLTLASPSALQHLDSSTDYLDQAGGALSLMHMNSMSPGRLGLRGLPAISSNSPKGVLTGASGVGSSAEAAGLFTPPGRYSSRKSANKGKASILQSPDAIFRTPMVPLPKSYIAELGTGSGFVTSNSGLHSQLNMGSLSWDSSIMAAMNLTSPTGWAHVPAATADPAPHLQTAEAAGQPAAAAASPRASNLAAFLGGVPAASAAAESPPPAAAITGSPVKLSNGRAGAGVARSPTTSESPEDPQCGAGSPADTSSWDPTYLLTSPGTLIPKNPLSSFYLMSPTTYTWTRAEPIMGLSKSADATAADYAPPAVAAIMAEPTTDMLSRLLARPAGAHQDVAVDAGPGDKMPATSTHAATASEDTHTVAAPKAPAASAVEGSVGNLDSSHELVSGAELLLGLAAMAVVEAAAASAPAASAVTVDIAAAVESPGVQDAATALVLLSPRKRARKPKFTSPSAATSEPAAVCMAARQPAPTLRPAVPAGYDQPDTHTQRSASFSGGSGAVSQAAEAAGVGEADVHPEKPEEAILPLKVGPSPAFESNAASGQLRTGLSARKRARRSKGSRRSGSSSRSRKKASSAAAVTGASGHRLTAGQQQAMLQAAQRLAEDVEGAVANSASVAADADGALPAMPATLLIKQEPEDQATETVRQETQLAASCDLADCVKAVLAQPPSPSYLTRSSMHSEHSAPDSTALGSLAATDLPAAAAQMPLGQTVPAAGHVADSSLNLSSAPGVAALQLGMAAGDREVPVLDKQLVSVGAGPAAVVRTAVVAESSVVAISPSKLTTAPGSTVMAVQNGMSSIDWTAAGPADVIAALQVNPTAFELPAWLFGCQWKKRQNSHNACQQQLEQHGVSTVAPAADQGAAVDNHESDLELFTPGTKRRTKSRSTMAASTAAPVSAADANPAGTLGLDMLSAAAEAAAAAARQAVTSAFPARGMSLVPAAAETSGAAAAPITAALLSPPASSAQLVAATPVMQPPRPMLRSRSTARKPPLYSHTAAFCSADHPDHPGLAAGMTSATLQAGVSGDAAGDITPLAAVPDPPHAGSDTAPAAATAAAASMTPASDLMLQPYYIDPSSPDHIRLRPKRAAAKDADARRKQQQEQQSIPLQALTKTATAAGMRVKQEAGQAEEQQQQDPKHKRRGSGFGNLVAAAATAAFSDSEGSNKHNTGGDRQQQLEGRLLAAAAKPRNKRKAGTARNYSSSAGLDLLAAVGAVAAAAETSPERAKQQQEVDNKRAAGTRTTKESTATDNNEASSDGGSGSVSEYQADVSGGSGTSSDSWRGGSSGSGDESDHDSDYGKAKRSSKRRAASAPPSAVGSKRSRQPARRGPSSSSVTAPSRRQSPAAAAASSRGGSTAAGGSSNDAAAAEGSSDGTATAAAGASNRAANPKGGRPLGAGNRGQMVPRFTDQSGNLKFGCRSTVFTGVYRCKRNTVRWRTQFSYGGKVLNVGSFPTELDAAQAWNAAAIHFRGRDTWLNPVEPSLPEDGGVAVAEKLPQPPWGSLLLTTMDQAEAEGQEEQAQQPAAAEP